jgi:23S rRNA pseudouridine2605 synthase
MARHKRRRSTARPAHDDDRSDRRAEGESGKGERLQKVLAAAGVGSRRDCEELISEGRVEVDGKVVTELGTRVDPIRQEIRVDTETLRQPQRQYFAINKPIGVVTTNFDPSGRPRVIDLVPTDERVFAVGRLDRASEGLILVTNDGEFANRITHPRYGVEKTYLVRVAGQPTTTDLDRLKKGVYLSDGFCRVQSITAKKRQGKSTDMVMVLNEGRNRELRRILARVGHKVLRLKRIAVGPIKLADLPTGAWRKLLPVEVENLLRLAKEKRKAGKAKRKPARPAGSAKPVHGQREESPYLQQQALMAQPL